MTIGCKLLIVCVEERRLVEHLRFGIPKTADNEDMWVASDIPHEQPRILVRSAHLCAEPMDHLFARSLLRVPLLNAAEIQGVYFPVVDTNIMIAHACSVVTAKSELEPK